MKIGVTRVILLMALPLALLATSCQKKIKGEDTQPVGAPSPVEIRFKHVVDKFSDLYLDSNYAFGLMFFKVSEFKYYISNVEFVNADGDTVKIPETYFFIDHKKPETMKALFNIPADEYYAMSFMIGIDSARNVSGAQTGALDPALGMFWDRNNGYIMAKLEGSTASGPFVFHIGGYKAPYSVLSRRHFKLGGNISATPNRKVVINMTADVIEWFRPNNAALATNPLVNTPGETAFKIGQNYYKMFDFISTKYE